MAVSVQQPPSNPPVAFVGYAFVQHYFLALQQSPELLYLYYEDKSLLGRLKDGVLSFITTLPAIKKKILSVDYGKLRAEITSVDTEVLNGGLKIVATVYLIVQTYGVRKKFTQLIFLAPRDQEGIDYYISIDIFRSFVDRTKHQLDCKNPCSNAEEVPTSVVQQATVKTVSKSFKENLPSTNNTENWNMDSDEGTDGDNNGSVFVSSLPLDASATQSKIPAQLMKILSMFGLIAAGGVTEITLEYGMHFVFVEFEEASAAQSAVDSSPIMIDGHQILVLPSKKRVAKHVKNPAENSRNVIGTRLTRNGKKTAIYDIVQAAPSETVSVPDRIRKLAIEDILGANPSESVSVPNRIKKPAIEDIVGGNSN